MKTDKNYFYQFFRESFFLFFLISSTILYPQTGNRWSIVDSSILTVGYGTTLYNGNILMSQDVNGVISKHQIYEFRTNSWKITGSAQPGRTKNSYITLNNNTVLVAGRTLTTNTTDIYNPQAGEWFQAGATNYSYSYGGKMHLLPTGEVLLISNWRENKKNKGEVFNPNTLTWQLTDTMKFNRVIYSSISLPDGRVLVAGAPVNGVKSFEVYDPITRSWNYFPVPVYGTSDIKFLMTNEGRLLMFEYGNNAEEYNFSTNSWEVLNFSVQITRQDQVFELDNKNILWLHYPQYGWAREVDINTGSVVRTDSIPYLRAPSYPTRMELIEAYMYKMGNGKYLLAGGWAQYFVQSDLYLDISKYTLVYTPDFIAGTTKDTPKPEKIDISVYPNPFSHSTTVAYSLPQAEDVKIEIYNTLGEKIMVIDEGMKSAGNYKKEVSLPGASAGIYFCVLTTQGSRKTAKIVLAK